MKRLLGIHFIGAMISFMVFSYQYTREHGFVSWLLLGEIVPAMKSIVWEVFLVTALLCRQTKVRIDERQAQSLYSRG